MPERPIGELKEQVGKSKKTVVDFNIEAGKVEEFARAIKDDNLVFRSEQAAREQGYEKIPVPLTYLRVASFPRYRPEGMKVGFEGRHAFNLGFDPSRSVHGEQEYRFERPIYVGDTLTGITTFKDISQKEGSRGGTMTFATFETAFQDESGDHVATERTTLIETADGIEEGNQND
ncbi:FAS1-like dehydratase domain-containing protein [Halobellus captivus]|uniref:FAS1-like dehydratase domain-containing protein n=1 Tax=Halobellus captivus TaxID=2592614 RepID=UPI0011A0C676|nr:MaoC family dehydratase N-terminal domain-containing protein [Halobellus captivus]